MLSSPADLCRPAGTRVLWRVAALSCAFGASALALDDLGAPTWVLRCIGTLFVALVAIIVVPSLAVPPSRAIVRLPPPRLIHVLRPALIALLWVTGAVAIAVLHPWEDWRAHRS